MFTTALRLRAYHAVDAAAAHAAFMLPQDATAARYRFALSAASQFTCRCRHIHCFAPCYTLLLRCLPRCAMLARHAMMAKLRACALRRLLPLALRYKAMKMP